MSISKKVVETDNDKKNAIPKFQKILEDKFQTWTKIEDPDVSEALKDLCGDSFFEMRKMTAQLCRAIESGNLEKNKEKEIIENVKRIIDDTWRCIIDKQKVGIDKLGIIVRKYVDND